MVLIVAGTAIHHNFLVTNSIANPPLPATKILIRKKPKEASSFPGCPGASDPGLNSQGLSSNKINKITANAVARMTSAPHARIIILLIMTMFCRFVPRAGSEVIN